MGSEENYEYLQEASLGNYVKYNTFHKEASRKWKSDPTRVQNWQYDEERDEYICSRGRVLRFLYERTQRSKSDYRSTVRIYESLDCRGCPHQDHCVKKNSDPSAKRRIYINRRGN